MKKLFLSITMLICAVAVAMAADNTAQFIAYVAEANDATNKDMSIYLENAGYSPAFNNKGEDATKMARVANKPYVYTLIEGNLCGSTGTNNLEGTFIVVCTATATQYTFSFASVDGRDLYLKDHVTNTYTCIKSTNTYTFTAAANSTLDDRFEIVSAPAFQVCAYYDNVKITGNIGTDNIVITTLANDTIVNVAPQMGVQTIDMSGKDAGHYVLTVNGTNYEFCNKPVSNK